MAYLNRDAARDILFNLDRYGLDVERMLDALEACVQPAPQQIIDRDALVREVVEECARDVEATAETNDDPARYELLLAAHSLRTQVLDSFELRPVEED